VCDTLARMRKFLPLLPLAFAATLLAQTDDPRQLNFVPPSGPGRFVLDMQPNLQWGPFNLYDDGTRPVAEFHDPESHIVTSVILFPNNTGTPTAEGCRDAVIDELLKGDHFGAKNVQRTSSSTSADASYTATKAPGMVFDVLGMKFSERDIFRFFGNQTTCAEVHVSLDQATPQQEPLLQTAIAVPVPDMAYAPQSEDYFNMGKLFGESQSTTPGPAGLYYERSLAALAETPQTLTMRRVLTDEASMSYGVAGDLKHSRALNDAAIAKDPTYPLYYYNLACADAEEHKATAAQQHLQQAFDRRANTLEGETLPDPAKDDSIQKLKKDKTFWAFVLSLPKSK
jgi:hypothetical protein